MHFNKIKFLTFLPKNIQFDSIKDCFIFQTEFLKKKDLSEINAYLLSLCSCTGIYNACSISTAFKHSEEFWISAV